MKNSKTAVTGSLRVFKGSGNQNEKENYLFNGICNDSGNVSGLRQKG